VVIIVVVIMFVIVVVVVVVVVDDYWSNTQYCVRLQLPDKSVFCRCPPDTHNRCSLVISLMQKDSRRKRTLYQVHRAEVAMAVALYKV